MSGRLGSHLVRAGAVIVLAAAAAGAVALERHDVTTAATTFGSYVPPPMPLASSAAVLSSTWFCPGVPVTADGSATGQVSLLNPSAEEVRGTITFVPSDGPPVRVPVAVPAGQRLDTVPQGVPDGSYAAALVELEGGSVSAEQGVSNGGTVETTPCASAASGSWFLAAGDTTEGEEGKPLAGLRLLIFNPFSDRASLDISFSSDIGTRELKGEVVEGGSLDLVEVGASARRASDIAVTVTARTGRVVVGRVQTYRGSRDGEVTALAVPESGPTWLFPDLAKGDGVADRLHVSNPGDRPAEVTIELRNHDPAATPLVPVTLPIPPGTAVTYDLSAEEAVAAGHYAAQVETTSDVPVVVEQVSDRAAASGASGVAIMAGSPLVASAWLFPSPTARVLPGAELTTTDEIAITNPTAEATAVTVSTMLPGGQLVPVPGAVDLPLETGASTIVRVDDKPETAGLPIIVQASAPVVAARLRARGGETVGLSRSLGIPVLDGPIDAARLPRAGDLNPDDATLDTSPFDSVPLDSSPSDSTPSDSLADDGSGGSGADGSTGGDETIPADLPTAPPSATTPGAAPGATVVPDPSPTTKAP